MHKKWLCTLFVLNAFNYINAQDSTKQSSLKISGSADIYYQYDFNNPKSSPFNNFTSFTNSQNSFELGMLSLKLEHNIGKAGILADIGFGKRAADFSYNDENSALVIKQLFFTYAPSSKIKLSIGSWSTHIGYELPDAYLNRNYSMSYLFSYGPFFHTGLKAEYAFSERTSLMVGLANPADLKNAGNLPKMVIAQLATFSVDEKLKAWFNYQGGKNNDSVRLYQGDIVLNYTISDKLSLGYNGTWQLRQFNSSEKWEKTKNWRGNALYINSDPKKWLGFTLRLEYFDDKQNVLGLNTAIFESTFSADFKINNLTIIPEFRFEKAGRKMFSEMDGAMADNKQNFLLGAAYHF